MESSPLTAGLEAPPWRKIMVRLAAAVMLAAVMIWLLRPYLRTIPEHMDIEPWLIPAYLGMLGPYHLLRACRWHTLLKPLGCNDWRESTLIGLAGFLWVALLPLRLGEFARVLFLYQRRKVPPASSLAVVGLERLMDGLIVCVMFFVALPLVEPSSGSATIQELATIAMTMFATALLALTLFATMPRFWARIVHACIRPVSSRLADAMSGVVGQVAKGLATLPSARALAIYVATSLAFWTVHATGLWVLARGCGLELSPGLTLLVLSAMNIVLIVPGGPAQLGSFQGGLALGLSLVVSPERVASSGSTLAFVMYACQLSTVVLLGLWAQRRMRLDWRALIGAQATTDSQSDDAPAEPGTQQDDARDENSLRPAA